MLSVIRNHRHALLFMMPLLFVALLSLSGCGGKDEPATPGAQEEAAAGAPSGTLSPEAPVAMSALGFMPESAQIAVGIPPVNGLMAKVKTFSERYSDDEFNPQLFVEQWVDQMGPELGVPGATTLGEIAAAKGVDFDAPMAVFLDFTPAMEAITMLQNMQAVEPPASPLMGLEGAEADNAMEDVEPAPQALPDPDAEPRWVGVVQAANLELAKATLLEVAADSSSIPDEPSETVDAGGVEITVHDPERMAYFISGDFVVFGSSLAMVREAASRVAAPAPLHYGTDDFPAAAPDELVMLVYPSVYTLAMEESLAQLPPDDPATAAMQKQAEAMKEMFSTSGEPTPIAMSLTWDDDAFRLNARASVEDYPGLVAFSGQPSPFRLVNVLPDDTLAFLGIRFTDEFKKQAKEVVLPSIALATQEDPAMTMAATWANQVIDLLGDEIAIGITRIVYDFPSVYAMLGVKDAEQAKLLLQLFVPSTEVETYRGLPVRQASGNMPIPINYVLASNALLVSNDVDGLKKVVDRVMDGEVSGLLDNIGGGFGSKEAYYSALYIDNAIFSDVVLPTADMVGAATPGMRKEGNRVTSIVDDIRMTKGIDGEWVRSVVEVGLKPAPEPAS